MVLDGWFIGRSLNILYKPMQGRHSRQVIQTSTPVLATYDNSHLNWHYLRNESYIKAVSSQYSKILFVRRMPCRKYEPVILVCTRPKGDPNESFNDDLRNEQNFDATTATDSPGSNNRLAKVRILSVPQNCSEGKKKKKSQTKTEEHWQVGNTGQDKLEIL